MYQYDDFDRTIVEERAKQFRDQVRRRLEGRLSEDEFRPLRLQNGLYLQLHAYMLRVAIPYGLLSSEQLRKLAEISRRFDRNYGHFTTRQNLQYHWIKLEDVPDILDELASVEMHCIQTSGNCVRNVTSDHFAGAIADEIEDPRPYCEMLRQWSTFHPEFAYLPRKFKIAVTGASEDRAATRFHDIGIRIVRNAAGEVGFEMMAGGGMGRTPIIAKVIRPWIEKRHLLSYCEAILRVYNQFGRRDNLFKSRIKILVHELGLEEFRRRVDAEWAEIKDTALDLDEAEIERMRSFFRTPAYRKAASDEAFEEAKKTDRAFAVWAEHNLAPHKVPGYAIVTLSLKKPGVTPGDATAAQMEKAADLADRFSFGEIRVTHEQNLVFADVEKNDLYELWRALKAIALATPNINTAADMICCPGLDYCSLANARSIPVAEEIALHLENYDYLYDLGELKIKMSGCINACGHHHVGHIGVLGVDKKGEEFYQITLGGSATDDAAIGSIVGPAFSRTAVVPAIQALLDVYVAKRREGERFLDTYRRIGLDPFKEGAYATHSRR